MIAILSDDLLQTTLQNSAFNPTTQIHITYDSDPNISMIDQYFVSKLGMIDGRLDFENNLGHYDTIEDVFEDFPELQEPSVWYSIQNI